MKHSKLLDLIVLIGLIVVVLLWWGISEAIHQKDPLNKPDAFVYSDSGILNWLELTSKKGKVEGKLHERIIYEEIGSPPFIEEEVFPLTGELVDNGYEFRVVRDEETVTFDAHFTGSNLLVTERGKQENKTYEAVDATTLQRYIEMIQKELEEVLYHAEKKEKDRIMAFFDELRSYFGYLYQDESTLMLIQFDEALYEGELSGSLLMLSYTEEKSERYEEMHYQINGITDGLMINLYTTVDGNEIKLEGDMHENASLFELSVWTIDDKLTFHAVTEQEYHMEREKLMENKSR